jgi:hypothetical protein
MDELRISKISIGLFILLYLLIYIPGFQTPFVLDDFHAIVTNQFVHSLEHFTFPWVSAKAISSNPENYGYRPMTFNFFQLMWALGDGQPFVFQIAKKIILLLAAWMTFLVWKEWQAIVKKPDPDSLWWGASVFAFAFFLLHPVSVQVGNYIGASTSLLAGLFYMSAFYLYLKYRRLGKLWHLCLGALAYFLAVMSKEDGITLIAVLFIAEIFFFRKKLSLPSKKPIFPFLLYLGISIFSAYLIGSHFEPSSNIARGDLSRSLYFATQWRAYFHYMGLYFWPVGFNFDNLDFGFADQVWTAANVFYLSLHLLILIFATYLCVKINSIGFAVLGFYISILPASSIIPLAEAVSDHRDFIPFLFFGFAMIQIIEWATTRWLQDRFHEKALLCLLLLALSGATFYRNRDFISEKALWVDTVLKNPRSPRAKSNLATIYMENGDYPLADALLTKCTDHSPFYMACLVNLGIVKDNLGHRDLAEKYFRMGIASDPSVINSRLYYAEFLFKYRRYQEAKTYLEEANQFAGGLNKPVLDALEIVDRLIAK